MGLYNWLRTQVIGTDLDAEQQRNDTLNAQQAAENQRSLDAGIYDSRTFAIAEAQRLSSDHPDVTGEVADAFNASIQSTVSGAAGAVNGTLKLPFQFLFKALPWQVWVLGAVLLFFYLGGGVLLRGILARNR